MPNDKQHGTPLLENPDLTSSVISIKKNWIRRLLNLYPAGSLDFVIAIYIYIYILFFEDISSSLHKNRSFVAKYGTEINYGLLIDS